MCSVLQVCTDEEMSDFPRRMRDWLFNVMNDLAQNEEFPSQYKTLQTEAESNMTRRWVNICLLLHYFQIFHIHGGNFFIFAALMNFFSFLSFSLFFTIGECCYLEMV